MNDQEAKLFLQQIRNVSKNETQSNTKNCVKIIPAYVISVSGQMAKVRLVSDANGENPFTVPIITSQSVNSGDYVNLAYWDNLSTAVLFCDSNNYPNYPHVSVRPKLNDNPFFLVNQRGQSSYTGPGYGPDRWMVTGQHKLDMLDGGGVKLTVASGSNANQMIQQYLEPEIFEQLNGKQVTLAAIVTENEMSLPTYFRVGSAAYGNIPAGQTGLFFATATINYKTGQNYIGLQCSDRASQNGESISLRAFTMEEGSIQTLGYIDSSGKPVLLERPDPLELVKCKRYLYVIPAYYPLPARAGGSNRIQAVLQTPAKMRIKPTVPSLAYFADSTGQYACTLTGADISDYGVLLSGTTIVQGKGGVLFFTTQATISSEL